jgi:hypothetical protein
MRRPTAAMLIAACAGSAERAPPRRGIFPPVLRAIAVLGAARSRLLPDVPTADESGLPGFEAVLHYGLPAPAGTLRPVIERLNKELRAPGLRRGGAKTHPCRRRRPAHIDARGIRRRYRPRGDEVGR